MMLIEAGANWRVRGSCNRTVAHYCADTGNTTLLEYIGRQSEDELRDLCTERDDTDSTALHCACRAGGVRMLHLLMPIVDLSSRDGAGRSVLYLAVLSRSLPAVQLLTDHGASLSSEEMERATEDLILHNVSPGYIISLLQLLKDPSLLDAFCSSVYNLPTAPNLAGETYVYKKLLPKLSVPENVVILTEIKFR